MSHMIDVPAWARTILSNCPLEKQEPSTYESQAASTGRHCTIHRIVMITFDKIKQTIETSSGLMSTLVTGIRLRKRHIETLVHIKVANVWIHSP